MRLLPVALSLFVAAASATEPTSYDLKKLERIDGPSFRPTDKQYPAELAATGVQGEALVLVTLTNDGNSDGATLGATSRSEQLDKIAVDFIKSAKFQVKEAPARGWKAIIVPVGFYKDSVTTLKSKTCADFNVDFDYQSTIFPERKPAEMRIFEMLTGILYFGAGGKPAQAAEVAKRTAAARQPTIDGCRANPENFLLQTWQASVKAAF